MSLMKTQADHVGQPIWNPYYGAIHILEAEVAQLNYEPRYYVVADRAFDFETTGKIVINYICPKTKNILVSFSGYLSPEFTTDYIMCHLSVLYGWTSDLFFARETSSWLFKTKEQPR